MKVVRCGSTAFGSVVEDRPIGTKFSPELEKGAAMFRDGLAAMLYMGDGEVGGENRHGIAKDQVFASVEDSFLAFREMIQAEETSSLVCILFAHVGQATLDSSRVVLEADGKSPARDIPLPDSLERFAALPKVQPRPFLLG
jgi:hypothetical protein